MGYLFERHELKLMNDLPEGTCPICGVKHEEHMPHNRDSLIYQYKFYDEHGKWPTWADAMEHCPETIKKLWTEELEKKGIKL